MAEWDRCNVSTAPCSSSFVTSCVSLHCTSRILYLSACCHPAQPSTADVSLRTGGDSRGEAPDGKRGRTVSPTRLFCLGYWPGRQVSGALSTSIVLPCSRAVLAAFLSARAMVAHSSPIDRRTRSQAGPSAGSFWFDAPSGAARGPAVLVATHSLSVTGLSADRPEHAQAEAEEETAVALPPALSPAVHTIAIGELPFLALLSLPPPPPRHHANSTWHRWQSVLYLADDRYQEEEDQQRSRSSHAQLIKNNHTNSKRHDTKHRLQSQIPFLHSMHLDLSLPTGVLVSIAVVADPCSCHSPARVSHPHGLHHCCCSCHQPAPS